MRMKHKGEENQAWLKILEESVNRGAGMVRQVLSLARETGGDRVLVTLCLRAVC
jgi:hypothetical protein